MTLREFEKQWQDENNFIIACSSGSSGEPKEIQLYKSDMIKSALSTLEFFNIERGERFFCPMDFKYIGAKMMYVRAAISGGELLTTEPSNNFEVPDRIALMAVVPSQVECLVKDENLASKVKTLIIGGASLSRRLENELLRLGVNAFKTYGMTETSSHVALAKVGTDIYKALSGVQFFTDENNCLIINIPDRHSNCVRTNDVVELINNQNFRYIGRFDNVINSGGIKIHPEALEREIKRILNEANITFNDLMVHGEHSDLWGTQAVCKIDVTKQLNESEIAQIYKLLKAKLSDSKQAPKKIYCGQIEKTPNGKIKRS